MRWWRSPIEHRPRIDEVRKPLFEDQDGAGPVENRLTPVPNAAPDDPGVRGR